MTRLYVKKLCERCGKEYGTLWGCVGLGDSDVVSGVCFDCEYEEWKTKKNKEE